MGFLVDWQSARERQGIRVRALVDPVLREADRLRLVVWSGRTDHVVYGSWRQALELIPAAQAEVIRGWLVEGKSRREVAAALGLSTGACSYRCRMGLVSMVFLLRAWARVRGKTSETSETSETSDNGVSAAQ